MENRRIAVLVDGDNISAQYATKILDTAAQIGRVDLARVYAAMDRHSEWLTTPGYRLMHAGTGKNAADLLLCVDAMECALEDGYENFMIVTSDGDFSHLAHRLRERGLLVHGMGQEKAPIGFRSACTGFSVLQAINSQPKPVAAAPTVGVSDLDEKIRRMILLHSKKGQGMRIVDLAPKMHSAHGTLISTLPERSWRAYLSGRPNLFDLDPRGPEALVRFLPAGFAAT